MTTAEGFAPAKINLTLHVTGQRADGYHLLDSLVVFADVGDRLWYRPGDAVSLDVTGPFEAGVPTDARNLVWQAAEAAGWTGEIRLEKNLPHGAGIGGGSSDAAAVLRDLEGPHEAAVTLGADVPVCLFSGPQRMCGIGEQVEPVPGIPGLQLVLVNPGVSLPTPSIFRRLTTKSNPAMADVPACEDAALFVEWLRAQRNDLQAPATELSPEIRPVLEALADADLARMSGSGATCFGIYATAKRARSAAERIAGLHPNWWVQPCRTIASDASA